MLFSVYMLHCCKTNRKSHAQKWSCKLLLNFLLKPVTVVCAAAQAFWHFQIDNGMFTLVGNFSRQNHKSPRNDTNIYEALINTSTQFEMVALFCWEPCWTSYPTGLEWFLCFVPDHSEMPAKPVGMVTLVFFSSDSASKWQHTFQFNFSSV